MTTQKRSIECCDKAKTACVCVVITNYHASAVECNKLLFFAAKTSLAAVAGAASGGPPLSQC